MNLYQHTLMDHYRNPRNKGTLDNPDFSSGQINPSCGDEIIMQGCITNNQVTRLVFDGHGCVITQATASMLTEAALNKSIEELAALDKDFVLAMIGMELGPTRIRCALLPLEALHTGLANYTKGNTCSIAQSSCKPLKG
ncbi:MAG TPA: iron-sulfur cluster assembly scaffold protein [Candidatus Dependentiae bacterium]|nr:iron-sulfur cluster assembly scaffold protein [Candidatus Dependentiae bacterium]HRQ62662.1 iron-sulfur cluster assembly scaffold protein [Candidatus Dependentiae bacterium]